jgi:serine/threonine-protein kinase
VKRARGLAAIVLAVCVVATAPAYAQNAADKATAEALFDQGRTLLVGGDYAAACPKFSESLRLDAGLGAMLYVAQCYEHAGQTASAWAQFREAAAIAAKERDSREQLARDRAARLEPTLSKLVVLVSAPDTAGLVVMRDGSALGRVLWGVAVPVDPGAHVISARAPGKKEWAATAQVWPSSAGATITVPRLEEMTGAPPPEPVTSQPQALPAPAAGGDAALPAIPPAASDGLGMQRAVALVAGGFGLVGVALGSYFGMQAEAHLNDSNAAGHCRAGNRCDAFGVQARSEASTDATISTIAFAAGGAAIGGAVVLWLTVPGTRARARVGLAPSAGNGERGLFVRGAF